MQCDIDIYHVLDAVSLSFFIYIRVRGLIIHIASQRDMENSSSCFPILYIHAPSWIPSRKVILVFFLHLFMIIFHYKKIRLINFHYFQCCFYRQEATSTCRPHSDWYSRRRISNNDSYSTIKNKSSYNTLRFTIHKMFSICS